MPPTAELLLEAITKVNPTALACTPSLPEDICDIPEVSKKIPTLESLFYGGAPLARSCGDTISKATTLINGIGSTEAFGFPAVLLPEASGWKYFE